MAASPDQSSEMTEDYSAAVFDGQMLDEIATLEDLMALNITNSNEVKCLLNFLKETYPPLPVPVGVDPISAFCNSTWDGVSCWPTTLAGTTSVLPCVEELDGIKYDTASKLILTILFFIRQFHPSFIRSGGCGFDSIFSQNKAGQTLLSGKKMDWPVTSSRLLNYSVRPKPGV